MSFPDCPFQGFGLGYRERYEEHFLNRRPAEVSWAEVITENYFFGDTLDNASLPELEALRKQLPVAFHGVSLSLGSVDPVSPSYLRKLKELADRIAPLWISDHLCWTGMNGENLHDLLPLPYTEEAIRHLADKIARVQDALQRRILVENVSSYLEFAHSEMPEWEFLLAVVERADCGILLDVNNIFVSSVNHGFDPETYLHAIPPERVGQVHLAGHRIEEAHCLDTHDQPVCDGVWALYRKAARHLGAVSTMIERDDNFPPWETLLAELIKAREIWSEENEKPIARPGAQSLRAAESFSASP